MNTPAKPKVVRKYIMTPDFKPLFALAKDFGPTHGPLDRPVPTTIGIIGQLLRQSGRDAVTIFEVKKVSNNTFTKPVQLTLENYTMSYDDIVAGKTMPAQVQEPIDVHVNTVKATVVGSKSKSIVHTLDDMVKASDEVVQIDEPAQKIDIEIKVPEYETPVEQEPAAETIEPEIETSEEITETSAEESNDVEEDNSDASEESESEDDETPESEDESEDVTEESAQDETEAPVESTENATKKLTKAERKALRRAEREKMT